MSGNGRAGKQSGQTFGWRLVISVTSEKQKGSWKEQTEREGMSQNRVIVIGGGASGMVAAISAARRGADVTLLEHTDKIGKKILATGNGRCNLTNELQGEEYYRGGRSGFVNSILEQFGLEETLSFFGELGLVVKSKKGYVYPYSEQASAVLDVLKQELRRLQVKLVYRAKIRSVERKKVFYVHAGECYEAESLIIAAGSKAAPSTGSDGSGYLLAEQLGHTVIKPLPALVQLKAAGKYFEQLAGIRTEAEVSLIIEGTEKIREQGELQLTKYGISGIPVFQISRYAAQALDQGRKVQAVIDFFPVFSHAELYDWIKKNRNHNGRKTAEELMGGLLNKKLAGVLLETAEIEPKKWVEKLTDRQIKRLAGLIKRFPVTVTGTNSFEQAQVCAGGVNTGEIDGKTMESCLVKGLYFAGEILDIDGACGGYNLQFAWSSGWLAGSSAAQRKEFGAGKNKF